MEVLQLEGVADVIEVKPVVTSSEVSSVVGAKIFFNDNAKIENKVLILKIEN
jgi:hypothetical protein